MSWEGHVFLLLNYCAIYVDGRQSAKISAEITSLSGIGRLVSMASTAVVYPCWIFGQ